MEKELHINNAQYSVLEASEDFMKTALILVSGLVTDRIGGASLSLLYLFNHVLTLTVHLNRRHALGQCHLQYRCDLYCSRHHRPIVQIHDIRVDRPGIRRHRHASGTVQSVQLLVRAIQRLRIDSWL